jgi:hypothetical protein
MWASDLRRHLQLLEIEWQEADACGLTDFEGYREDLEAELAATRRAYVCAAVIEIAYLRAELESPRRPSASSDAGL